MNMPINICLKCGNPRNLGERICCFCGETFPDVSPSPLVADNEVEIVDVEMTEINSSSVSVNSVDEQTVHSGETTSPVDNSIPDETPTEIVKTEVDKNVSPADNNSDTDNGPVQNSPVERIPVCPYGLDKQVDRKKYYTVSKKALWIWVSVLLVIGLCIGGFFLYKGLKGNSPSDVVTKAFDCLKDKDYDGFCSYMDLSNKSKALMNDLCPKVMKWYGDDIDHIEAKSEKIDEDDTAVVNVSLYFKDGKTKDVEIKMVKIKDKWKIRPFGDFDVGLDSLLGLGSLFGFDTSNSFTENILNIVKGLF